MKLLRVKELCRDIRYELQKGSHAFSLCDCGRNRCRGSRTWEQMNNG